MTFDTAINYFGKDFPQTYIVKEAPRCRVTVTARRRAHDLFPGSDFGKAATRILEECAGPPKAVFGHGRGGILPFRLMWETEVKGIGYVLEEGLGNENATLENVVLLNKNETS